MKTKKNEIKNVIVANTSITTTSKARQRTTSLITRHCRHHASGPWKGKTLASKTEAYINRGLGTRGADGVLKMCQKVIGFERNGWAKHSKEAMKRGKWVKEDAWKWPRRGLRGTGLRTILVCINRFSLMGFMERDLPLSHPNPEASIQLESCPSLIT